MTDSPIPRKQGRPRVRDAIAAMTPEQREQWAEEQRADERKAAARRPFRPLVTGGADPAARCQSKRWKNADGPQSCVDAWAGGSVEAADGCPKCREWLRMLVEAAAGRRFAWSQPMQAGGPA